MSYNLNKNIYALNAFFSKLDSYTREKVPHIIANTANNYFKERFIKKSFDGVPWKPLKKKSSKGSLMIKSSQLMHSIHPSLISPSLVRLNAGNYKVPYARIHNEGGVIERGARSETFIRNRYVKGKKSKYFGGMGAFKKGSTAGVGLSFKAFKIVIPQRQLMGHAKELNQRIKEELVKEYKHQF